MNWRRVFRLLWKELLLARRDRRMLLLILVSPVIQLFLFGYVVSTDVHNVATAIQDDDRTSVSRTFVNHLISSQYFTYVADLHTSAEVNQTLDRGTAQVVIHIPRGFARAMARNHTAQVQAILDGTDAMTAGIISGYAADVVSRYSTGVTIARLARLRGTITRLPSLETRTRIWYNPELKSVHFMVPGVLCMILMMITMMLTSLAIVKEKEVGTLEQLIVTPLTPVELMVGKTAPFLLIGAIDLFLVLAVAVFWFHVRLVGSLPLLVLLSLLFLLTSLGLGLLISTFSHTQHEAMLTSVFFLLPSFMLSGFMFPIENMPAIFQYVTYLIPMRYFLEIIRGIFLKGTGLDALWPQTLALLFFGVGIIMLAAMRFQKRLT